MTLRTTSVYVFLRDGNNEPDDGAAVTFEPIGGGGHPGLAFIDPDAAILPYGVTVSNKAFTVTTGEPFPGQPDGIPGVAVGLCIQSASTRFGLRYKVTLRGQSVTVSIPLNPTPNPTIALPSLIDGEYEGGGDGGDGLDEAQVDARIYALVRAAAFIADTTRFVASKIITGDATVGHVLGVGAGDTIVAGGSFGAVDQTARNEAAAAQTAADAAEADAAAATTAAVAAQSTGDAAEAEATAARATANAAQSTANTANTNAAAAQATANTAETGVAANTVAAEAHIQLPAHSGGAPGMVAKTTSAADGYVLADESGGGGTDVDYSFIEGLPLHFVADDHQFIQARPDTDDLAAATLTAIRAAIFRGHQAGTNVYYNDSNELSFGPILSAHNIFPRAATIPDHTADDAPELFFLTDAITVGPRDDANVVVGYWNYAPRPGPAGFGSALVGFTTYTTPNIGSINRPNGSLAEIEGFTDEAEQFSDGTVRLESGGTFSVQLINSHNEEWIEQWTHVLINSVSYALGATIHGVGTWHRNILNFPDDLTGDFMFNLRSSADEYFFTGSGTVTTHPVGLYTMSTNGYSLVAGFAAVHPQGRGVPQGIPDFPGQPYTNNLGELWIGAGEVQNITVQAVGSQSLLARTPRDIGLYNRDNIGTDAQFAVFVGDGGFSYPYFAFNEGTLIFRQNRGGTVAYRSWSHVWDYLSAIHPTDVQAARIDEHSVNLGIFTSHQDAHDELDRRFTQQIFDEPQYRLLLSDLHGGHDPHCRPSRWRVQDRHVHRGARRDRQQQPALGRPILDRAEVPRLAE